MKTFVLSVSRRAFTLIELMTVLAILAVLTTLTLPSLLKAFERTSSTSIKSRYDAVKAATFLHFTKTAHFATAQHPLTFHDGFAGGWDRILAAEQLLDSAVSHQVRVTTVITNASYINMNTHAFYQLAGIRPGTIFAEMVVEGNLQLAEGLDIMIDGTGINQDSPFADLKGLVIYDFGTNQVGEIHLLIKPR